MGSIRYIPPQRIKGLFSLRRLKSFKLTFFIFNFFLISPHGLQQFFPLFVLNVSSHFFENTVPFSFSFLPSSLATIFSPSSPNLLFLLPISLFSSSIFTPSLPPTSPLLFLLSPKLEITIFVRSLNSSDIASNDSIISSSSKSNNPTHLRIGSLDENKKFFLPFTFVATVLQLSQRTALLIAFAINSPKIITIIK